MPAEGLQRLSVIEVPENDLAVGGSGNGPPPIAADGYRSDEDRLHQRDFQGRRAGGRPQHANRPAAEQQLSPVTLAVGLTDSRLDKAIFSGFQRIEGLAPFFAIIQPTDADRRAGRQREFHHADVRGNRRRFARPDTAAGDEPGGNQPKPKRAGSVLHGSPAQ